jgi:hypothetical protein
MGEGRVVSIPGANKPDEEDDEECGAVGLQPRRLVARIAAWRLTVKRHSITGQLMH